MRSKILLLSVVVLLTGCAGDQRNKTANRFGDLGLRATEGFPPATSARAPIIEPEVSRDDLDSAIVKTRTEFQASQNATTNSLTGLGAQITKVAETFEASLLRLTAEVTTSFKAVVTANNEMKAHLEARIDSRIEASAEVNAQAIATAKAELKAEFTAQVQAGINNRIENTHQTVTAGGAVKINDYSEYMFRSQQTSDRTTMWIVIAMSAAFVWQAERSRARADRRACGDTGETKCDTGLIRRFWRWFF